MAETPYPSPAEPLERELRVSRRVATALWVASAAMMALLLAWSTGPYWPA